MKKLIKILAAVVAAVVLSSFAGAAFTDSESIGKAYIDDVNMLSALGVINGYPDGSFRPDGKITRAEFAKMAYVLQYGEDRDGEYFAGAKSRFSDVEGDLSVAWAKGYINYCESRGVVSGVGGGRFNPRGNVTVAEASKMLLVILGCNAEKEGLTGVNWLSNTVSKAMELGILRGVNENPNSPASRELCAKLMRNALYAATYVYNPITGVGSQLNALSNEENETLGEKTMGLGHFGGIIAANENYALPIAQDIAPTGKGSGACVIYNKGKDMAVRIDRTVSDELLGAKVDVFFKADKKNENKIYSSVEVIGSISVSADACIYDVASSDVSLMPDGNAVSPTEITPYILFKADGKEFKITAPDGTPKVQRRKDYSKLFSRGEKNAFSEMSFASETTASSVGKIYHPDGADVFFSDMGKGSVSGYRFVSNDGGKTFSYIIRLHNAANSVEFGGISAVNDAKKTVLLPNLGSFSFDELEFEGELKQDEYALFFIKDGKLNIKKTEEFCAPLEALGEDGSATIGGKKYFADAHLCRVVKKYGSLAAFYAANKDAEREYTIYRVSDGIILDIEAQSIPRAENYAVILGSSYDEERDIAYVRLGLSDNTEKSYRVGKFFKKYPSRPKDAANDRPSDYAENARFGWAVGYSVMEDGSADLSYQDFKTLEANKSISVPTAGRAYGAAEKSITVDGKRYYDSGDATVFFIYGEIENGSYLPVKSKAYKLSQIIGATALPIGGLKIRGEPAADALGSVVTEVSGHSTTVVAAAMTHGSSIAGIEHKNPGTLAYVVRSRQMYSSSGGRTYASFELIGENGVIRADTVDDVTDFDNNVIFKESAGYGGEIENYENGTMVRYTMSPDGKIDKISSAGGRAADMQKDPQNEYEGLFFVNAAEMSGGRFVYYSSVKDHPLGEDGRLDISEAETLLVSEDGCKITTICDDKPAGERLITVARNAELKEGSFNAIIELKKGKVSRVFSFED